MKKNNLLNGAFVASLSIIFVKFLGVIYLIPFNAIIGDQGGALFGYGYQVYNFLATISMVGLPLAISKLVSRFNSQGDYEMTNRVFGIARKIMLATGIVSFLLMFVFAKELAYQIIGHDDITNGNTIEDVVLVIRAISFTILVVPSLSVTRGYLQGFQYITPTSISQMIEQVVRVVVILVGAVITGIILKMEIRYTVAIATFSAFTSALASFGYLIYVKNKNKHVFEPPKEMVKPSASKLTNNQIVRLIFLTALPFVAVGVTGQLYNMVDLFTVVKTLEGFGYANPEAVFAVLTTWGYKLISLVLSISMGFTVSLIPSITKSFNQGKHDEVREKINKTYQVQMFFVLPLAFGLFVLKDSVYTMFYGESFYGPTLFGALALLTIFSTSFTISSTIMQGINRIRLISYSLLIGLALKIALNVPMMYLFNKLKLEVGYAPVVTTSIAYGATILFNDLALKYSYKVDLRESLIQIGKIMIVTLVMAASVYGLKQIIPFTYTGRINALIYSIGFAAFGGTIFIVLSDYFKLIDTILGEEFKNRILRKLRIVQ